MLVLENKDFYGLALEAARYFSKKYYTVSNTYEPDEIVNEVVCKILKSNLTVTPDSNIKSIVYLLVSNMYVDLGRSKNFRNMVRGEVVYNSTVSIQEPMRDGEEGCVIDIIPCVGDGVEDIVVNKDLCEYILEQLSDEGSRVSMTPLGILKYSVKSVIRLKIEGYSSKEIADMFGVRSVSLMLKKGREVAAEFIYA